MRGLFQRCFQWEYMFKKALCNMIGMLTRTKELPNAVERTTFSMDFRTLTNRRKIRICNEAKDIIERIKLSDELMECIINNEGAVSARIKSLFYAGANTNVKTKTGSTPLMFAASNGNAEACALLIGMGANVNAKDAKRMTALMRAALSRKMEICRLLIENKADVDMVDSRGMTALMYSARDGYLEICELLIDKGADVNKMNEKKGLTALMLAEKEANYEIYALLIDKGAKE
jgi:ankyrin repeat protein